jgi:subtilisin family serine protease
MNPKTLFTTLSIIALVGCGGGSGGSGSNDGGSSALPPGPITVSGFTLEERRAHKEIINAEFAENRSITGAGVKVVVFDSGVNINHTEFNGRSITQDSEKLESGNERFSSNPNLTAAESYELFSDGPQDDERGHGSAVVTTMLGEEGGIARDINLRLVDITTPGKLILDGAVIIGVLNEGSSVDFDFMSASLGGTESFMDADADPFVDESGDQKPFWETLESRDVGLIVAAGNDSEDITQRVADDPFYQTTGKTLAVKNALVKPQFLYVGSVDNAGVIADFSNTPGSDTDIQDRFILAPGKNIVVAVNDSNERLSTISGTSFSTPIVASAAALVKSATPTLANRDVLRILLESADKSFNGYDLEIHGQGILDIEAALNFDTSTLRASMEGVR